MKLEVLVAAFLFASVNGVKTPLEEDYYHAAVVEYMPVKGSEPEDTLSKNVNRYITIITEAAKKADIVVFPEGGLNFGDLTVFTEVPYKENEAIPVGESPAIHQAIKNISQAAKLSNVYVAINIHEEEERANTTHKYNTNVIFDRNGSIVARYRKFNLYSGQKKLDATENPEFIYFDSDFGVRFGTFTCFDILFKDPSLTLVQKYNVTDIIFTSQWFSELPFLTAIQQQASWSYASNTNLLASGVNAIERGSTGSGIYAGNKGPVVYLQSQQAGTRLLTAKLYKKGRPGRSLGDIKDVFPVPLGTGNLKLKKEYLEDYMNELLLPETDDQSMKIVYTSDDGKHYFIQNVVNEQELCQSEFCCKFQINMTLTYKTEDFPITAEDSFYRQDSYYHYRYRLAVFNGIRSFDGLATGGSQVCGIIPCLNNTFASCGLKTGNIPPLVITSDEVLYLFSTVFNNITITTSSLAPDSYTFPQFLESSQYEEQFGSLDNYSNIYFHVNKTSSKMSFSSSRLVSAAIYNRVFSRDGGNPGVVPSSAYPTLTPSSLVFYLTTLLFMTKVLQMLNDYICNKP